jgi:hypothetical protein
LFRLGGQHHAGKWEIGKGKRETRHWKDTGTPTALTDLANGRQHLQRGGGRRGYGAGGCFGAEWIRRERRTRIWVADRIGL